MIAALATSAAVITLAACSDSNDSTNSNGGDGPITVTATETECDVALTEAPAGTIEFEITNEGSKVTEFYLYAEGDRIMGEVENIGPGLTRTFHVEVSEGGEYETACKPGMVGDGIRGAFTVAGNAGAAQDTDAKLAEATASYERYVKSQTDALVARTQEFVDAVKDKDVDTAKELFPVARTYWERIEPVAEAFADLDPKIDGREDVIAEGMEFTGYHRLEKDLWVDGLQADSSEMADQLMADINELVSRASALELNPLQLANGSKALLDEVATGKITGEEDRYSHTDLWDFRANVDGSEAAIAALRPVLDERDPELVATLEDRFNELDTLLEQQRDGDGFILYTELTEDQIRELAAAVDAVAEPVSKVAGVVAEG